uniref:Uncharacterized protein n=1 Tax=Chenopodium quinoa TaxID=63459 RepID=A0A803M7G5_CHEQI
MPTCGDADAVARALTCRNSTSAAHIKLISSLVIFATSIAGISFPVILAKSFAGKPAYDRATLVIKCYAAGVILSTSLVHVLPDAFDALGDCVVATRHPWKDFPFAGLVTLIGALLALLVDLAANSSHAEAGFSFKTTAYMCFMFSVTTPVGIILGMIIFSLTGYDDSSANALISEGLLGSLSSGILIYMALVDLISADFFHNKLMSSETKMKKGCYIALVLGSASMSILALWA